MNGWGLGAIAIASALVAAAVVVRPGDAATTAAVIGFASGIVTGTFGILTGLHVRSRRYRALDLEREKVAHSTPNQNPVK